MTFEPTMIFSLRNLDMKKSYGKIWWNLKILFKITYVRQKRLKF